MTDLTLDSLIARARTALWLIIASNAFFALTDLRLHPESMTWVFVSKALQVAVVGVGLRLLRRCQTPLAVSALVLAVIAGVAMLVAASGAVSHDFPTTVILCVALAWGAATLLPWTAGAQTIAVLLVSIAMVSGAYWQTGEVRAAFGYPSFAVGFALALSVYVTHAFDRQRQALAAENLERTRAEAALRAARDTLEVRVRERTAELERANADLHAAAHCLRESEARFQILSELTSDYTYSLIIDPTGSVLPEWGTDAARHRITGYTSDELDALGGGLALVHPEDLPIVQQRFARLLAGETDVSEFRIRIKRGEARWLRVHGHPVRDSLSGRVVRIHNAAQDITDQKAAEAALRDRATEVLALNADLERRVAARTAALSEANRELEAFSYSVSHDLRAPLRSIDGFSKALVEDFGPQLPPEAHDLIRRVSRNAIRMGQLIDDLLKLARVGIGPLRRRPVNLTLIARRVADDHRQRDPDRRADFVLADDVLADGEETLLRLAMENLLDNAWKYTSRQAHARIEFGVEDRDGQRVYFVRDNGVGFDMAYAAKLFRPFERLHDPGEFDGTGVGLATVARIVRRHGGRIWAEAAEDAGATFSFTLAPDAPPAEGH